MPRGCARTKSQPTYARVSSSSRRASLHAKEGAHPRQFRLEAAAESSISRRAAAGVAEGAFESAVGRGYIAPADHAFAPEQGQRVVPELAFRRGRVGLEAVGPAPEDFEAAAVPDYRIEGREQ